ncbi:MAG TPA: hypothetical protein VGZ25_07740, partial [Gemmataceae bacterium]|nr:hypothetical protein [Gemmataceae bacterium]
KSASTATDRIASTWYSGSSFTVDVKLTDGQTHQVSMYLLDWDSAGRSERVDILDAATGTVLSSQTASSFNGGKYLVWNLSGHVQIRVTSLAGPNAVLSGLFFDGKSGQFVNKGLANIHIAPKLQVISLTASQAPVSQSTNSSPQVQQTSTALNNALIFSAQSQSVLSAVSQGVGTSVNSSPGLMLPVGASSPSVHLPAVYNFGGEYQSTEGTGSNQDKGNDSWDSPWFPEIYIDPKTGEISVLIVQNTDSRQLGDLPDYFLPEESDSLQNGDERATQLAGLTEQTIEGFAERMDSSQVMASLALGAFWMTIARANREEKSMLWSNEIT